MKRAVEGDDPLAPRGEARQFDRRLDRLGSAVREEHLPALVGRHRRGQPLAEADHRLIVEIGRGHMAEPCGLFLDGGDDAWVGMTRRHDGDASVHVEIPLTIGVPDVAAQATFHDQWVDAPHAGGEDRLVARDERAGAWPGNVQDSRIFQGVRWHHDHFSPRVRRCGGAPDDCRIVQRFGRVVNIAPRRAGAAGVTAAGRGDWRSCHWLPADPATAQDDEDARQASAAVTVSAMTMTR